MKKKRTMLCLPRGSMAKFLLKMKLLTVLMFSVFAVSAVNSYSQATKFNLKLNDVTVMEVFQQIEKNSEFILLYNENEVDVNRKVNVVVKNKSVESILDQIFDETKNIYKIYDRQIVILENENAGIPAILKNEAEEPQQKKEITGTVTGEDGQPIPGASIIVKGTTTGTITDIDGNFELQIPVDADILLFSFVGMEKQEIAVDGKSVFDVTLLSSLIGVDEVVVTALGISREKKALGYSVSTVSNEDINQGGTVNMLKSLDGKVTGLNIVSLSSDPTSSVLVNIRGATSIAGIKNKNSSNSSQPLYILDGIPIGNGTVNIAGSVDVGNIMSGLNPDDIESITVLKGASAAALYGSEAGNGVIMITTKTGAKGAKGIGVNFTSSIVFDQIYNPREIVTSYFQGGRSDDYNTGTGEQWGPAVGSDLALNNDYLQWDMAKQEYFYGPLQQLSSENRVKEFSQTGSTHTTNLSVTGNYDKGNYRLSLTNLRNISVWPDTKSARNSVSFYGKYNLTDKVSVSSNVSYTRTHTPNKAVGVGRDGIRTGLVELLYYMSPNHQPMSVWKEANTWIDGYEGYYQNTALLKAKGDIYDRLDDQVKSNNPYFATQNSIREFVREHAFGKIQFDWEITENFSFLARTGINKNIFHFQQRVPWDSNRRPLGEFRVQNSEDTRINSDLILTFNKQFGKFEITANAGYNYVFTENVNSDYGGYNLARANDFSIDALQKASMDTYYDWGTGKFQSVYGTATIGFDKMLYLDITGRNDWGGITEQQKNNYFYPSVSLSWIASQTFELPEWISFAKARAGIAQVGHGIGTYPNVNTYGFSGDWNNARLGTVGGALVDPNIDPEVNTSYEFGVDFAFLKNRIAFDFTAYNKSHENQIDNIPVVTSTGFSSMTTNIGTVVSKGIESSLTFVPVQTKDWNWSVTGNLTTFDAEITELREGFEETWISYAGDVMTRLAVGEKVGDMWVKNGYLTVDEGEFAGQRLLYPSSGTPLEDSSPEYRTRLGNYNPDYILGINTSVRYKRFNLNVVASYRNGGVYSSETLRGLRGDGKVPSTLTGDHDWWEGGRVGQGGFPWPDPNDIEDPTIRARMESNGRDFDDASYIIGVYVDPRSGADENDMTLGGQTWDDNGVQRPYYIQNGADPNWTIYRKPAKMFGNQWAFPQERTFDATNFKIKEITLTYDIPRSFTEKFYCQGGSFSLIAKNIYFWNKSGLNEDPEAAFSGEGATQGVARSTMPAVRSWGVKLNLNF